MDESRGLLFVSFKVQFMVVGGVEPFPKPIRCWLHDGKSFGKFMGKTLSENLIFAARAAEGGCPIGQTLAFVPGNALIFCRAFPGVKLACCGID